MPRPTKRTALDTLTKARLVELDRSFDLFTPQSHPKADLVDALARSKKASFEKVLAQLRREELKGICRAHDLDDGGRAKDVIVARILGREDTPAPKPKSKQAPETSAQQIALPIEGKLELATFFNHLWAAADILRGSIDSSDYKAFIFGFLFLKRLSDRFEEEAEAMEADGESHEIAWNDPGEHPFFVPDEARWKSIRAHATNVGEALNVACARLEEFNGKTLEGVLTAIDFNDPNKLGNTKNRDAVLGELVTHFSKLNLRNDALSEPDMLGRAYEYLIEQFADDAGKKGGEFFTPFEVTALMVRVLNPADGMRVCDPTVGSGGLLIAAARHVARTGGNPRNLSLYGQEKNLGTWGICKMNMLLHGRLDADIRKGDTIRDPQLLERGELMLFDRVMANPPFSLDVWGIETAQNNALGRFRFGVPPKSKGDLAFVQHMLATTRGTGKVGVVMPHGVLFRGAAEGRIREKILREDLFEAVIGLPPNLFHGTGIPASILVFARNKDKTRKGKVLFIDASGEFAEDKAKNKLREQDIDKVVRTFEAFEDVEKYARVVGLEEIEKNDFNLNISRYVDTSEAEERIDVGDAVRRLRELERERAEAERVMDGFLEELGYGRS